MMKTNRYSEERFTKEEIEIIEKVAKVVCYVFDVTISDLRGKSRLSPLPDARKVLAHYIANNIVLENIEGSYNTALSTWYLNVHHSTSSYYVKECNSLYETNKNFRIAYDNVVGLIDDVDDYEIIFSETPIPVEKKPSWEMVRKSGRYTNATKVSLMPTTISDRLVEMYNKGYALSQIAYDLKITVEFVKFYVSHNKMSRDLVRSSIHKLGMDRFRSHVKYQSSAVDY